MEQTLKKSLLSYSSIVILAVIVLFVNGISKEVFGALTLDLTEENLYSLSSGSKEILRSLEDPITLRLYYSKTDGADFPAIKFYGERIVDLLRSYARQSKGKVTLEIYDPRPDSEEEDWAQRYGDQAYRARLTDLLKDLA